MSCQKENCVELVQTHAGTLKQVFLGRLSSPDGPCHHSLESASLECGEVLDISGDMNHVYRVSINACYSNHAATTTQTACKDLYTNSTCKMSADAAELGHGEYSIIVKLAPEDVLVCIGRVM